MNPYYWLHSKLRSDLYKVSSWANEGSRWSNLASFSNTGMARSTIAAPFVAFAIFFNERIREYFEITVPLDTYSTWQKVLELRLEVFYLGLVALGLTVAIIRSTMPRSIGAHPRYSDYVQNKLLTKSKNAVSASFILSLQRICEVTGVPGTSIFDAQSNMTPPPVLDAVKRLVDNEFEKYFDYRIKEGDEADSLSHFYSGAGWLKTDEVLEVLINQRRVERAIWEPILDGNNLDDVDVFRLEYHLSDYGNARLRISLLIFLVISLGVVFIPTALTVLDVLGRII